ncbi:MAG: DNA polymerase III subunit alpha [Pseudomonadota bacterium]
MIPLTTRSYYSLMWGTGSPAALCRAAKAKGYDRIALTDTDNLYGLWPFLSACKEEGITPIVGAEITDPATGQRAVCLVENQIGYGHLCRLITRRHAHEKKAFDLKTEAIGLSKGLIFLTQSVDFLTAWHEAGITVAASAPRRAQSRAFALKKTARHLGVPFVATPGSFFIEPADAPVHRLLRAIDTNGTLTRLSPQDVAPEDAWLATPADYAQRFALWPEALRETHLLAERLSFTGPCFGTVLPPWSDETGRPADVLLREAAYAGAQERYGYDLSETVVERMEEELRIIGQMGFSSYFLVVKDIVSRSPRICGRGSGAASLVAYALFITNVCPIRHNLYFARFLNPGRSDPPDIDVDFAWDERDDVLSSVLHQHAGYAAMVCNHVAFQPRMAVREIAKVYGLTDGEIGRISKKLPWFWETMDTDGDLLNRIKTLPRLRGLEFPPPWPEILSLAQKIIGIPRYLSVHPGGIIITPGPIDTYVPIETAPKGVPIIQWEKDGAEAAGLVKIDLLGNRSLGVIRDAIKNLRANGDTIDEAHWEPEEDPATKATVARGDTMGCFYIESPATRLLQQKARVGDFEHLVIHSSIIRPAANTFIQEYLRRLHGGSWEPIHPLLADVLDETYGIMVYQEDVSKAAVALAGFSDVDADGLRKIMSKKDKARRLGDYHEQFRAGALALGVTDREIEAAWEMMMSFSGYSFCKPHSASYARVSFQAAWLKTHFPAEFMAAVISNQGGFYSPFAYVSEAKRLGLTVLPPDVNQSDIRWIGRGKTLRVGFLSVKGLSARTQERIVSERRLQPFQSVTDFLIRVRPDDAEARHLIHCGALDAFGRGTHRGPLIWALAAAEKTRKTVPSLFDKPLSPIPLPSLPPDNERERLRREFAVLGFLCDHHPMTLYETLLKNKDVTKARNLDRYVGNRIRMAGWLITGKVVHTKHGEPMEFLSFEDETGIVETTFFPKIYDKFCHMIDWGRPYLLSGRVEQNWGAITLTADTVAPLGPA